MELLVQFWNWFTYTDPNVQLSIAPLLLGGIMAGAGLLKSATLDRDRANRQRKLAAETARYSPWTGMTPQQVEEPDYFGSALQFGATGASLGQNLQGMKSSPWQSYGGGGELSGVQDSTADLLKKYPGLAAGTTSWR